MTAIKALDAEKLSRRCDPESFSFATTAELEDPNEVLGQKRALEAIRFAIGMKPDGYNLFALGPSGLGKHAVVRHVIEARAAEVETPPDWCYVFNFDDSQKPRALRLLVGLGCKLQADMTRLLQACMRSSRRPSRAMNTAASATLSKPMSSSATNRSSPRFNRKPENAASPCCAPPPA